jgi:hypothetical protein
VPRSPQLATGLAALLGIVFLVALGRSQA